MNTLVELDGERVNRERLRRGLSWGELAHKVGCHPETLTRAVRGGRRVQVGIWARLVRTFEQTPVLEGQTAVGFHERSV